MKLSPPYAAVLELFQFEIYENNLERAERFFVKLLEDNERMAEALERIGSVDHPSVADKTSWIVMCESICLLARKTHTAHAATLRELAGEGEGD